MEKYKNNFEHFVTNENSLLKNSIVNCGYSHLIGCKYHWDGATRYAPSAIWQYTISGYGILEIDGVKYTMDKGKAMFLTTPDKHCYYLPKESPNWEFIYVTFNGSELIKLVSEFRALYGSIITQEENDRIYKEAIFIIDLAKKQKLHDAYYISQLAYSFIMRLFSLKSETNTSKYHEQITNVKNYCIKNIDKNITIDKMAKIANSSKYHFCRIFKEEEKISAHQFLLELKMQYAVQLLQTTNLSNKEIALKCGYNEISNFYKIFKKINKVTPNKFRINN